MSMAILVQAGMATALVGSFAAAYLRFSRPLRVSGGKPRVTPTA